MFHIKNLNLLYLSFPKVSNIVFHKHVMYFQEMFIFQVALSNYFIFMYRWANRSKSCFKRLVALVAVAHILGNIMSTTIFLFVSHQNYPGGQAMQKFHQLEKPYRGNLVIDAFISTCILGSDEILDVNVFLTEDGSREPLVVS